MPMRRAPKALWAGVAIAMLVPVGLAFAWSMGDRGEPRTNAQMNTSSVRELENSALPVDYIEMPTSSKQETVVRAPSTGNAGTLGGGDGRGVEIALLVVTVAAVAGTRWMTGPRGPRGRDFPH